MLAFFRKIRYKLMETGKSGKYIKYAIGEIVLVVIGILIALQINNWNEGRKEQAKAQGYYERLKEDLSSDYEQYSLNFDFYNQVFDYGNLVLTYAEEGDRGSSSYWELLVAFFHASQVWPILPASSTYEELRSAGELSLIQSVELRNSLSYYHGGGLVRYSGTVGILPPYRKMVRGLFPTKLQNYLWDNCHDTFDEIQILKECDPYLDESQSKQLVDSFVKNKILLDELRFYMSGIKAGLYPIKEQQKLCNSMLDEIEKLQSK